MVSQSCVSVILAVVSPREVALGETTTINYLPSIPACHKRLKDLSHHDPSVAERVRQSSLTTCTVAGTSSPGVTSQWGYTVSGPGCQTKIQLCFTPTILYTHLFPCWFIHIASFVLCGRLLFAMMWAIPQGGNLQNPSCSPTVEPKGFYHFHHEHQPLPQG